MPDKDYLKYWRVIRYYMQAKYNLSTPDLEMMLFLYSEKYFNKDKFYEFDQLLCWDKKRFDKLRRDKWIVVFRKADGKSKALYDLSYRAKRVVGDIYKYLNGEEIPMQNSSLTKKGAKYTDRVYRDMILQMNQFTRQQRRLARQ